MCHHLNGTVPDRVYPDPTSNNKLCYFFHRKHHDYANTRESQWLPRQDLTDAQEFGIFDEADRYQSVDDAGDLFGVRIVEGKLKALGTCGQQMARFWKEHVEQPWHGHPLWPLVVRNDNIKGVCPLKALIVMKNTGLVNKKQFRRLSKGR